MDPRCTLHCRPFPSIFSFKSSLFHSAVTHQPSHQTTQGSNGGTPISDDDRKRLVLTTLATPPGALEAVFARLTSVGLDLDAVAWMSALLAGCDGSAADNPNNACRWRGPYGKNLVGTALMAGSPLAAWLLETIDWSPEVRVRA